MPSVRDRWQVAIFESELFMNGLAPFLNACPSYEGANSASVEPSS